MTLKLAVSRSRPSVPYGANLFETALAKLRSYRFEITVILSFPTARRVLNLWMLCDHLKYNLDFVELDRVSLV